MRTFKHIALIILAILIWTAFVGYGSMNGFLLKSITSKNTSDAFIEATKEKIDGEFVGNFAMALIENGKISKDFFHSIDQPVNENTVFPVASVSKWVTSFGVLKLVEQGKLDLDKPVDDYLTRWHLPESGFDNKKVTVRKLLSHSSGLVDDLGYDGFAPDETVQTIEESLTKASDSEYSDGVAIVGYEPGSKYMYSGAGYTILQLLIEEISGQSFQEYMTQEVFEPLKMENSTFVLTDKPNVQLAQIYKDNGTTRQPNKFTALAAASLFTSTADLSKFLEANVSNNPVLSKETITEMSKPETFINDIDVYGLGSHLYSQNDQNSNIIGHDGSGNNAINTAARIDLKSKNGIIILETGNYNIASSIADEWIFWKAGIADYVVIMRNKSYILSLLLIGYAVVISLSIFIIRKKNKQKRTTVVNNV
ncbi:beta-lactamase class C AmpC-like protein [Psychroflexus torquis ATCC 700755]|uniref:Beta-lactamase class C AmpC-like protein n=1 Tax=Psychroflexus torquis (strain ATCC 700755 / CIP 106069 / ACAM 623) TaxID=313595 RepID=K4IW19_PSYTT|nr:serine hydrolase domain-containing protein [Psychroflexus torquis]AFU69655.1 beta-lactamase class C AmpC-like protein [Psychroflexus torquis ATCC 700755]